MEQNFDSGRFAVRVAVLFSVSFPFIIAFQIAAMLTTGWGTQGFTWLGIGAAWIPSALAIAFDWFRLRRFSDACVTGILSGLATTLLFVIVSLCLLVLMGPMDGGI